MRASKMVGRRVLLFLCIASALVWWRVNSPSNDLEAIKQSSSVMREYLYNLQLSRHLHFIPASNPNIHYVGRWTPTSNRLRSSGAFPGIYLDLHLHNTTSLLLSLHNSASKYSKHDASDPSYAKDLADLSLRPASGSSGSVKSARPIPIVAWIDNEEYITFQDPTLSLVTIAQDSLDRSKDHVIRVMAPEMGSGTGSVLTFQGMWLSKGGSLQPLDGLSSPTWTALPSSKSIHSAGKHDSSVPGSCTTSVMPFKHPHRKILEIVTDSPTLSRHSDKKGDDVLTGAAGWEHLLGELFSVDYFKIDVNDRPLARIDHTDDHIDGMGDVFFRSGPRKTMLFERAWSFSYVPDAMIFMLGGMDDSSIKSLYGSEGRSSMDSRTWRFEEAYVSFVQTVRRTAYPVHPAALRDYTSSSDGYIYNSAPATIPIFIVRPFTGELEHASHTVVERLQKEGDTSVFWVDTSGWLEVPDEAGGGNGVTGDFYNDNRGAKEGHWRLTPEGNEKVAAYLHAQLCHYLVDDPVSCPFLKHEAYTGEVYVPEKLRLDQGLQAAKLQKLKTLFVPKFKSRSRRR